MIKRMLDDVSFAVYVAAADISPGVELEVFYGEAYISASTYDCLCSVCAPVAKAVVSGSRSLQGKVAYSCPVASCDSVSFSTKTKFKFHIAGFHLQRKPYKCLFFELDSDTCAFVVNKSKSADSMLDHYRKKHQSDAEKAQWRPERLVINASEDAAINEFLEDEGFEWPTSCYLKKEV